MTDHLRKLVSRLDLETKVALVTGADFWTTTPIPEIGLRAMTLSDGPSGVRGPVWDERSPSLNLPNATALASSWDPGLAREYGAAAAAEARRKGVDVVLGPTINLHRSPLGGRTFEAFSEDPHLTGELAVAYVEGLQDNGVGACPKHYVANDSETDRFTVDVQVDERPLRELYLAPFERAVTESHAWTIMSSYNSVGGTTLTEHDLLENPLSSEWGFDGVVISDWTAVRSLAAASASQDLAMPGPDGPWGDALVEAVRNGEVDEAAIDRKVLRLLVLAERVGALSARGGDHAEPDAAEPGSAPAPGFDGVAFTRRAAAEGMVLLRNDDTLPLSQDGLSVAVIGQNAREARTQGGGSATVLPESVVSPLDGLRAALPGAEVGYTVGAVVSEGVAEIPLEQITNPRTGEPGLTATFYGADGAELFTEDRRSTSLVWFGGDAPIAEAARLRLHTRFTPSTSENVRLGFATAVHGTVTVDGEVLVDESPVVEGTDLGAAFLSPPSAAAPISASEGQAVEIVADFDLSGREGPLSHAFSVTLGLAPRDADPAELIAEAVEAAKAAQVAVVVVGTNAKVESEGFDRENIDLPGHQDELVRAVVQANPRTVVVVNSGAPVALPWRDDVAALLIGHFGGQEFGSALADVLTGAAEPGGRLATTWAAELGDVPVLDVTPAEDGTLAYTEGLHIGYRAWLRAGSEPAFPFGAGQGYTSFELEDLVADEPPTGASVTVRNTGEREGKVVVQVYAERPESAVERPARWLVGFGTTRVAAGESSSMPVTFGPHAFQHWAGEGWETEPGTFTLYAGTDVANTPLHTDVTL